MASALLGGSGLWAFVKSRTDLNHTEDELLLTIVRAHIIEKGERYIERGYIPNPGEVTPDFLSKGALRAIPRVRRKRTC